MGLFKSLFGSNKPKVTVKASYETSSYEPKAVKDLREPYCPSCGGNLDKIPGAKKACPHCGKFIFVRTTPEDTRVLVNEQGVEEIEEKWAIANGCHDEYLKEKQRVIDTKEKLTKSFGKEASKNDVTWSLLNQDLMENAKNRDWGLYRNTTLTMGQLVKREGKLEHALRTYLEVCYMDLNGPTNSNKLKSPELLKEFPEFDLQTAFIAPGLVDEILAMSKKLGYDIDKIEKIFIEAGQKHYESLKLYPLKPEQAWLKFRESLAYKN